jgi:hypothetical protein
MPTSPKPITAVAMMTPDSRSLETLVLLMSTQQAVVIHRDAKCTWPARLTESRWPGGQVRSSFSARNFGVRVVVRGELIVGRRQDLGQVMPPNLNWRRREHAKQQVGRGWARRGRKRAEPGRAKAG